jgi:ferric-dicitrate binding protein FerR (iron transport regulator)
MNKNEKTILVQKVPLEGEPKVVTDRKQLGGCDILLARYFSGEASELEQQELDEWLAESEENEKYFEEMTNIFQYSAHLAPMPKPNTEKALDEFMKYTQQKEHTQKSKTIVQKLLPYFSVAASLALVITLAFGVFNNKTNKTNFIAFGKSSNYQLFENVSVTSETGTEFSYNPKDKKKIVNLVRGEATFSVNSEQSGAILVKTGDVFIQDIGTVFTVIANNPEDSIVVEVSEGEVHFFTKNNDGINVRQNEKGIFYPKRNIFERITAMENIKEIQFDATALGEIIDILSVQYNVKIKTSSPEIKQLEITASFDPNETIDDILFIIAETLSLKLEKENAKTYTFTK